MERIEVAEVRSASCGERAHEIGVQSFQLGEGFQRLMSVPPETGASFTALLGLLENQSTTLLPSPESDETPAELSGEVWSNHGSNHHHPYHLHPLNCTQSDTGLLDQVSRFPVLAATDNSPETSSIPCNSSADLQKVKQEPVQSDSNPDSSPIVSDLKAPDKTKKSTKRKERGKKVKGSTKKSKNLANATSDDSEKLPYVHVRAQRGQATDSHSLAERARREKINARMKLLQELVPGCNKISGTALVLDEIINHVQSLQRQVEFLSMRLAAVNPRIDFNLGSLLAPENGFLIDSNFPGGVMPLMRPEGQINESRQHYQQPWNFEGLQQPVWGREEDNPSFVTPETSLFSYNSSANSD